MYASFLYKATFRNTTSLYLLNNLNLNIKLEILFYFKRVNLYNSLYIKYLLIIYIVKKNVILLFIRYELRNK